jgi:hypothetical protein
MREAMIRALVNSDFDSIIYGNATELLDSYLEYGHRGYRDYSSLELIRECTERNINIEELENVYYKML